MIRTTVRALILLAIASATAFAETPTPSERKSPWTGGIVRGDTSETSYCAFEGRFANGLTLSFARSREGAVTVAMMIPGLRSAEPGDWWQVAVGIDGKIISGAGRAQYFDKMPAGTIIAIPFAVDSDLGAALPNGSTMTVISLKDRADFDLAGIGDALTGLDACMKSLRR